MNNSNQSNSLLIDDTHHNLITLDDMDFAPFFESLQKKKNNLHSIPLKQHFSRTLSESPRLLFIGVPQNSFFTQDEIADILDFVRNGGSLFLVHRYGGDLLQKTNLNDLSSHFGIFFENSIVKDSHCVNLHNIPVISHFSDSHLTRGVHKIALAGSCSLRLSKEANPLCFPSNESWLEIYQPENFQWIPFDIDEVPPLAAYAIYGQGRVVAFSSADFFSKTYLVGLDFLDNQKFLGILFDWLLDPVSEREIRDWILQEIGAFSQEILQKTEVIEQIRVQMQELMHRIESIEARLILGEKDLSFS